MERYWESIDKAQLADADLSNCIVVLPLGATEQHGPHLPFETDSLIAQGVVDRLVDSVAEDFQMTVLPVEKIGYSPEHLDYSGSQSLSYDGAIERWINIGKKLNGYGFRKILLLNAHGGNSPLMTIVATELRVRYSMLAVATSWTRFGTPPDLISADERAFGIHGGDIETSVMLALHGDLVMQNKMSNFSSAQQEMARDFRYLRAYGKHAFGWKMQDLNPLGVVGDTRGSSKEKGEQLLAHSVRGITQLLEEMVQFDLGKLDYADAIITTGKTGDE